MASGSIRKRRSHLQRAQDTLQKRVLAHPAFQGRQVVFGELNGREKMSETLMRFIAPHLESVESENGFRVLVGFGVVAWNAALLERDLKSIDLDRFLDAAMPGQAGSVRPLLYELIERKRTYFADNRRLIVDYAASETRKHRYLNVVSMATEEAEGQKNLVRRIARWFSRLMSPTAP